jgi:predicted aspartyl protease
VIGRSTGQREIIDTVIDTGFDIFLSLPSAIIIRLGLPWTVSNPANLDDGSKVLFDFYIGTVIGDGQHRAIDVADSETEPLLGIARFYGYRLQIDKVEGGIVKIEAL